MREGGEFEAVAPVSPGRGVGSEGALDKCSEHFSCCGVVPGGLEVQGLGEGPPGMLTGGAADQSVLSSLDFLFAPRAEPRFWPMPTGMAQEVGGG